MSKERHIQHVQRGNQDVPPSGPKGWASAQVSIFVEILSSAYKIIIFVTNVT